MIIKITTYMLIGLLLNLSFLQSTALAGSKEDKQTAKVKAAILKLGTGNNSRIAVKLRDKTELKGYVGEISEDSFTIVNEKDNLASKIPYSQVKQVKGNNLSNGAKIAIGIGVLLALVVFIALSSDEF